MNSRTCPIKGCTVQIQNKMLMCHHHWGLCPKPLRSAVWRWYRPGQEKSGAPSPMYYEAARNAIVAVHEAVSVNAEKERQAQLL